MRYTSISAIGAFTALSSADTDYLRLDPSRCSGGADAPLRTTVEPKAGVDGVFVFPPFKDAQIITLAGDLVITSAGDESGYFSALDTLIASLQAALDAMQAAPGDLVSSAGTLSVWKYAALDTGWSGITQSVIFGLIVDG